MDGVIIDSEPLWAQAEKEVFSSLGVQLTDELCQKNNNCPLLKSRSSCTISLERCKSQSGREYGGTPGD
ncbi:hypothetical protein [uncultured Roseivirga sp.]|uniref:hypothetical protein n=1 Tax=uncultured Roseivirga sp. TaxID=543088 RepID=UPI00338E078C